MINNNIPVTHNPIIYPEHEVLFDNPWLKVKKNGDFIYSERNGMDSVAFILLAVNVNDERRIGLVNEFKDPLNKFMTTAFGGSIDDEKYHQDLRKLVKDEVMEESGFDVELKDISYYGKVYATVQSSEFVHLFSVSVDKLKQGEKTTTNPIEQKASVVWMSLPEIVNLEDWKVMTIIGKRMMSKNNMMFAKTIQK